MTDSMDTRQNLLETAIRLFATNGFAGTSIRDIAKATGMTISNIYYYFGSKYGLLLGVLEFLSKRLEDALKHVTELDMAPVDRFKELVMTHLDYLVHYSFEARVAFSEEAILSPATNKINKQFQRTILDIYRKELQRMQTAGYIKDTNITLAAFNVLGVIQWHQRWYRPDGPLSLEQIKEKAMAFILNGLLGNAKPSSNNK
jgi:AcrR family transcriptional regulator